MQTTTITTPETTKVATSNANEKSSSHVDGKQKQSHKQAESIVRMFYPRSEWSDTVELFGWIFFAVTIYFVSCELGLFLMQYLHNLPDDAFLYRYQYIFCLILLCINIITVFVISACSVLVLMFGAESIYLNCVKYLYVEGRNSYKWWQKKTNIELIVNGLMLFIWFIIVVELEYIVSNDPKDTKLHEDRFLIYRISGVAHILFSLAWILVHMLDKDNKSIHAFVISDEIKKELLRQK